MTKPLLNLDEAPEDTLERLLWLSGVHDQVKAELDAEYQRLYFEARLEHRLDAALGLHLHGTQRVLAWTRAENESRGRTVRWGDGF